MGMLLMAAFLLATTFTACSSDDVVKTQLETPAVTEGSKTVSSLAFNGSLWQALPSMPTSFTMPMKGSAGGVTAATSVVTTGLKPSSTYTLKVWAYSPLDSDKTTSPIATLTATTNAKTPLVKPTPTAETGNGGVTIPPWPAVEHADYYKYSYTLDGEVKTGSVETNSVTLTDLPIGEYTIQIIASSNDENFADSEPISLTFQRTKSELSPANGTYTSVGLAAVSRLPSWHTMMALIPSRIRLARKAIASASPFQRVLPRLLLWARQAVAIMLSCKQPVLCKSLYRWWLFSV